MHFSEISFYWVDRADDDGAVKHGREGVKTTLVVGILLLIPNCWYTVASSWNIHPQANFWTGGDSMACCRTAATAHVLDGGCGTAHALRKLYKTRSGTTRVFLWSACRTAFGNASH
jgi:hypothetical protein